MAALLFLALIGVGLLLVAAGFVRLTRRRPPPPARQEDEWPAAPPPAVAVAAPPPAPIVAELEAPLVTLKLTKLNHRLALRYRDRQGHITDRDITLHGVDGYQQPDGAIVWLMLHGYCHSRKAIRTFRLARVLSIADGTDGSVIDDFNAWIAGMDLNVHYIQK